MARRKSSPRTAPPLRVLTARDAALTLAFADSELSPRARAKLLELLVDVERMRAEADRLSARVRELEALADVDPLADVFNRRAFMRELSRMQAFAARHGGPVSVLYIDLDAFKAVNDRHGHRAGDAAIVHVAQLLRANLRETDSLGRLGGDEFAAALMRADAKQAAAKAEDLCRKLAATPLEFEGATLVIEASIGVYEAKPGDAPEAIVEAADAAMYERKKALQGSRPRRAARA